MKRTFLLSLFALLLIPQLASALMVGPRVGGLYSVYSIESLRDTGLANYVGPGFTAGLQFDATNTRKMGFIFWVDYKKLSGKNTSPGSREELSLRAVDAGVDLRLAFLFVGVLGGYNLARINVSSSQLDLKYLSYGGRGGAMYDFTKVFYSQLGVYYEGAQTTITINATSRDRNLKEYGLFLAVGLRL